MTPCPSCRAENAADATFCGGCRRYLGWQARGSGPEASAPPDAPAVPVGVLGGDPVRADPPAEASAGAAPAAAAPPERAWVGTVGLSESRTRGREPAEAGPSPERTIPVVMHAPAPPTPSTSTPAPAAVPRQRVTAVKPTDLAEEEAAPARSLSGSLTASAGATRPAPGGSSLVPPPPPRAKASGPGQTAAPQGPDATACPSCQRPVSAGQRFCRCGTQVSGPPPAAASEAPAAVPPRPWWQRIFRRRGDERDFRYGWRSAAGTARTRYNDAIALRARVFRGTMLLGCGAVGLAFLGPWENPVRDEVTSRVQPYLPVSWTPVPAKATVDPAAGERPDFLAAYALDGDSVRAWATGWKQPATAGECGAGTGGGDSALAVDLGQVTRVDRVVVRSGLDRERTTEWARQARPKTLDLAFSDSTCRRVDLADEAGPQTLQVDIAEASGARVTVVDAYPAKDGAGRLASLGEIEFLRKD
jgi:hypothetical protein